MRPDAEPLSDRARAASAPARADFRVHGLHCAEEAAALTQALDVRIGVLDLALDVIHERMTVSFDPTRLRVADITAAVARTGMRAEPWREESGHTDAPHPDQQRRIVLVIASAVCLLAAFGWEAAVIGSLSSLIAGDLHASHRLDSPVTLLYLAAIVTAGWHSAPAALRAVRAGRLDMNVLVWLSVCGAAAIGEWSEGAAVAVLFAGANVLESWGLGRARRTIGTLLRQTPQVARVVHGDHEHRAPVDQLPAGAIVRVLPGERIPVDGVVIAGGSSADESLLTGVRVASAKTIGDRARAGSMNREGVLDIRAEPATTDPTLSRMLRVIDDAHCRRADVERFVERFARYYTPATVALAIAVGVLSPLVAGGGFRDSFYRGLVVLVIACPCALVISTPVTVTAALTSAAGRGMLIKGGAFLEAAAALEAAVVYTASIGASVGAAAAVGRALARAGLSRVVIAAPGPGGDGAIAAPTDPAANADPRVEIRTDTTLERLPALVAEVRRTHAHTAFIGDGVGDAPAMAAATLAIAVGPRGTDTALETADIILLGGDLTLAPLVVAHARRTLTVIRENVAIALLAKAVFMAAAVAGVANLWMAAAADSGATLLVTFNGLRMLRAR